MPMTLTRRPRALRRVSSDVKAEVKSALTILGNASVETLMHDVQKWSEKPEFTYKVHITSRQWKFTMKYDKRTKGGKRYKIIDEGSGSYVSGGSSYPIVAKNANTLAYNVPSIPFSMPASGMLGRSAFYSPGTVIRKQVTHPGVQPREFSKPLYELLASRRSGSFHNTLEAAIKRAFRKSGIPT